MENIDRVMNMRIGYMNWTQDKFYVALIENIERVANIRIEYFNWITETKFYVIH
jgi:hypothetical protein